MQYNKFLKLSSLILLGAGLLGFIAMGPTANNSLFGNMLYFDTIQNIIHLVIAAIAFAALISRHEDVQRYVTAAIGIVAISATAYSFYRVSVPSPNLFIANIEVPLESLLYLAFGLWALWVVLMPPGPLFVKDTDSSN